MKEQIELVENLDGFKRKGEITLRGHMAEGLLLKDMEVTDAREKVQKGSRKWLSRDKGSMILDERMFESAVEFIDSVLDRKSTRLNSSHLNESRMPSSA